MSSAILRGLRFLPLDYCRCPEPEAWFDDLDHQNLGLLPFLVQPRNEASGSCWRNGPGLASLLLVTSAGATLSSAFTNPRTVHSLAPAPSPSTSLPTQTAPL